MNSKSESGS